MVIPFVIACGECFFCKLHQYSACSETNEGKGAALNRKGITPPAALFGYSDLYGGIPGGQAEYVRVPKANTGPFKVPDTLSDEKVLFLSDILPTAWQAVKNAEIKQGSSVAIYGAGPVGLLSAACARLEGAEQIFMIDDSDYRLAFARDRYGVIPINFDKNDDPAVLRQAIAAVRRGGIVSVPGVYAGFIHAFMFGDAFDKGLTFKMGQTHVHSFLPDLLPLIESGHLKPEEIVTHHMPLEEAARGYEIFDKHAEDCRKVILVPGLNAAKATI